MAVSFPDRDKSVVFAMQVDMSGRQLKFKSGVHKEVRDILELSVYMWCSAGSSLGSVRLGEVQVLNAGASSTLEAGEFS